MKRELTLTDIAGYLPHGLKIKDRDSDIWILSQLGNVDSCMDGDVGLCDDEGHIQYDYLDEIKPILRPMSNLYEEITDKDYNDGNPFVPLIELACLLGSQQECQWELQAGNKCAYSRKYKDVFQWVDFDRAFLYSDSDLYLRPSHIIPNEHKMYDLLHQLKFDYRGLIDARLAVSVHDLKQNPYERN